MRCLTIEEARKSLVHCLGDDGKPRRGEPNMTAARFYFGAESLASIYWVVNRLMESVGPWEDAWLWINDPDTWKRQGLHLYTRLRQSYGERRLIQEAPVHQFHGYEEPDLASFMAVAVLNEWSMYLITSHDYGRLYVSQSSGAEVWSQDTELLDTLKRNLASHEIELTIGATIGDS